MLGELRRFCFPASVPGAGVPGCGREPLAGPWEGFLDPGKAEVQVLEGRWPQRPPGSVRIRARAQSSGLPALPGTVPEPCFAWQPRALGSGATSSRSLPRTPPGWVSLEGARRPFLEAAGLPPDLLSWAA